MKNGVKITETKFYTTPNRVIVCELKCDMQLLNHPSFYYINDRMWKRKFPRVNFRGEFTVKAKARCHSTDTYDERRGKMIAESRAKTKMFSIAERIYKECSRELHKVFMTCTMSKNACAEARDKEEIHVKELCV